MKKDWTFLLSSEKSEGERKGGGGGWQNEREASVWTKGRWRKCGREGEEDSSQWNCEAIWYRFCHGCTTLTASCSSLRSSHVGWLLMEPSFPGWTSVMKFYSSYWIWQWDLCLSHSCSLPPYCTAIAVLRRVHIYIHAHSALRCMDFWV